MISHFVKSLGEVAIRVKNMDAMVEFYVERLGFTLRRRFEDKVAAIKLAEGHHGQVHTLTLFHEELPGNFQKQTWEGLSGSHTSLHHFAVTICSADYGDMLLTLDAMGVAYDTATHRWTGWKGIYLRDPEMNILELVCYDETIDEGKSGEYDFSKLHGSSIGKPFK